MLDIFKKLYSFYSDYIPILESLYSDSQLIKYLAKNQYLAILIPACGTVIAVFITVPLFLFTYLFLKLYHIDFNQKKKEDQSIEIKEID